jgi:tetratricopeptide (TPR) repeat protein
LAYAYRKNYRYSEAVKWYEKTPLQNAQDRYEYAFCLQALGRYAQAQETLKNGIGLAGADRVKFERLLAACDSALKFQNYARNDSLRLPSGKKASDGLFSHRLLQNRIG